jgi:hypothetical protein
MGYDTSHWQASQQPPISSSPRSEYVTMGSVPGPADSPYPPGFVRRQSRVPMSASWYPSQTGPAHPTYEDPYPQSPMSPRVQPGTPIGYDTSHWQASQQPPISPSPRSDHVTMRSAPGFVRQQSPRPMSASWSPSQDPAGPYNALREPYPLRSANEFDIHYNSGGYVGQQDPPPMASSRSEPQGSADDWISEGLQGMKQGRV